jgi:hypothetical protein
MIPSKKYLTFIRCCVALGLGVIVKVLEAVAAYTIFFTITLFKDSIGGGIKLLTC